MDRRATTFLTMCRDTVVALLLAQPVLILIGVFWMARLEAPHPGVGGFDKLMAWNVTASTAEASEAQAILGRLRAQPGEPAVPEFWLEQEARQVQLVTRFDPAAAAFARERLAGVPVDLSRPVIKSAVTGAIDRELRALQADPVGYLSRLRAVLPVILMGAAVGFAAAGVLFRKRRPVPGWDAGPGTGVAALPAIGAGVAIGGAGFGIASGLEWLVTSATGVESTEQDLLVRLASGDGLMVATLVLAAVVAAPIGEELFFRGHLFRWSRQQCGAAYAYIASSVLFAMVHFNPPGLPAYIFLAVLMAWSYQRYRTLLVPIAAHATNNAIAIALLIAGGSG